MAAQAQTIVEGALARFSDQISRVEIHLSDENGARGGEDKQEAAMDGAANKLKRAIESTIGRLRDSDPRTGTR